MGIHGNSTCVMNYDEAKARCSARSNGGLKAMFTMMNEARLGVGLQGLSMSEVAYQNAVAYAKDRLQGRSLSGPKAPDKTADPIIVHPDIRRSLMTMKAFNEAGRALALWTAIKSDIAHRSADDKRPPDGQRLHRPDDADGQGRAHRQGFRPRRHGAAGFRRPRLYRGARHEPVRARCPHRHDL